MQPMRRWPVRPRHTSSTSHTWSAERPSVTSRYDPPCGYVITANNDVNACGIAKPINMPMSSYRANRIQELLANHTRLCVEHFITMRHDVVSRQAQTFMRLIRALLPDSKSGKTRGDALRAQSCEGGTLWAHKWKGVTGAGHEQQSLLGDCFANHVPKDMIKNH